MCEDSEELDDWDDWDDMDEDLYTCDGCGMGAHDEGDPCPLCCGFSFAPGSEQCDFCAYYDACASYETHEYCNVGWNPASLLYSHLGWLRITWYRFSVWIDKYFRKCGYCGKLQRFFGISVGTHDECLPF